MAVGEVDLQAEGLHLDHRYSRPYVRISRMKSLYCVRHDDRGFDTLYVKNQRMSSMFEADDSYAHLLNKLGLL